MIMIIDDINKIPTKDKKRVVNSWCEMYTRMKNIVIKRANGNTKIAIEAKISTFDAILNSLSEEHRLIIENDFIYVNNRDPHWREERWSKSTYYKFKNEAMNAFLILMYA